MTTALQVTAPSGANPDILSALHTASAKTGSDFDYLLATAMRESNLDASAKSKGSSATGLFQFLDQTWLGLVKRYGDRYGMGQYADAIQQSGDGHFNVASKETKQAILALRKDPQCAALMAGESAQETKQSLECSLGRKVCGGELYAAHFLGEGGARQLIRTMDRAPNTPADELFPQAADANRSVFYHADGSAKTVKELYNWAVKLPDAPQGIAATVQRTMGGSARSYAMGLADNDPMTSITDFYKGPNCELPRMAADSAPASKPMFALDSQMPSTMPQRSFLMTPGIVEVLASLNPASFVTKRAH